MSSQSPRNATGTSCRTYSSPSGLNFTLYCDQDATNLGDTAQHGADTVDECMDLCAAHGPPICGAAAFDSTGSLCYFKANNITAGNANHKAGWTLGIADAEQLQPLSSSCTESSKSIRTENGLDFTVYCNQDHGGFDMCEGKCVIHTSTFDECLEYCSSRHPLCTGVAWDSALENGWSNCYAKNATTYDGRGERPGFQVGKALLTPATDDCRSNGNGSISTSGDILFKLTCGEDRFGGNITVLHAESYTACIEFCANYTGSHCVGAIHDSKMDNGYENCYLKSSIGVAIPDKDGYTFALRQNSSNSSGSPPGTSPDNTNTHQGSKAWIAGAVVGGMAVVIALLGILWWRNKRSNANAEVARNCVHSQESLRQELEGQSQRHEIGPSGRDYSEIAELQATNVNRESSGVHH